MKHLFLTILIVVVFFSLACSTREVVPTVTNDDRPYLGDAEKTDIPPIIEAVAIGNSGRVQLLLGRGGSVNTTTIEGYTPPLAVVRDAKRILAASRADLGSVEYLINGADDRVYYYDINPLSNFVADAVAVVGFEPTERLVDFILERAGV